jgi:hypothetical protein
LKLPFAKSLAVEQINKAIIVVLVLAALALFHAALVSFLLALGFTDAAETISINNPDIAEVQARHYRDVGVALAEAEDGADPALNAEHNMTSWQALILSREYWLQAINIRPSWPYYQLGALDVEVLLRDKSAVQQRIEQIIQLAPNERGLDESFLILTFIAWDWVEPDDKEWLLTRLGKVSYSTLKQVFYYAKQAGHHYDICAHLAWKKVKGLC